MIVSVEAEQLVKWLLLTKEIIYCQKLVWNIRTSSKKEFHYTKTNKNYFNMQKYTTKSMSNIITAIVLTQDLPTGQHSEEVIYGNLPTDEELLGWPDSAIQRWIKTNNDRMKKYVTF